MRGEVGTKIKLTIRRKILKPQNFSLKKNNEVKSVEASILGKKRNVGYLRLKSFNENSDKQLFDKIKYLKIKIN